MFLDALGCSFFIFKNVIFHHFWSGRLPGGECFAPLFICNMKCPKSRSHGAKHSPSGRGRAPDCLEGVPPVWFPGPPLIHHISASCYPNEEFSTSILIIFDVVFYGISNFPVRSREAL